MDNRVRNITSLYRNRLNRISSSINKWSMCIGTTISKIADYGKWDAYNFKSCNSMENKQRILQPSSRLQMSFIFTLTSWNKNSLSLSRGKLAFKSRRRWPPCVNQETISMFQDIFFAPTILKNPLKHSSQSRRLVQETSWLPEAVLHNH